MADENSEREEREDACEEEIRDILVVGCIGELSYQFVRIRQRKQGDIYLENRYKPNGPHFSYHASGEMHEVHVDQQGKKAYSLLGYGPTIAEFRGIMSLGAWTIYAPNLPIWKQFTPSRDRRTQLVVHFDMSRLSGYLCLNFQLIEYGREDLLEAFLENLGKMDVQVLRYAVITDTNPWILMIAMTV